MAKRKMDIFTLDQNSRNRFEWELFAGDTSLCSSELFPTKRECLQNLRAVQRHAATEDVRDDER